MPWFRPRPLIAVTGPSRSSRLSWYFIRLQIILAGGRSVYLTPMCELPTKPISGLILGGGADIDPLLYREQLMATIQHESQQTRRKGRHFLLQVAVWLLRRFFSLQFTTEQEDKARDELELSILAQSMAKRLPVLGICRGAQLINVYFGGSLHQDIGHFYTEEPHLNSILPKSTILVEPQSRLHSILQKKFTRVNSLHHQSVKTLGSYLKIVAQEPNGVVEAIEHIELPFVIGVQWHPEFLITYRRQRQLFHSLVDEARKANTVMLSGWKA